MLMAPGMPSWRILLTASNNTMTTTISNVETNVKARVGCNGKEYQGWPQNDIDDARKTTIEAAMTECYCSEAARRIWRRSKTSFDIIRHQ
jgi:hypothetical protein